MHNRFLLWFFLAASLALPVLRAQPAVPPASTPIAGGAEQVLAVRVVGDVQVTVNGQTRTVRSDERIPQTAKIVTGQAASVVLVFSNGATTQLGADTELVIDEFLQDPFASTLRVAEMTEEPSRSRTRLSLNRGELVGNVKKLKHANGSSFTVTTPVGAAGIRGTTFRIVFRPAGTGQAFGAGPQQFQFSISTLEGDVGFAQTGPGGPPAGTAAVNGVAVPTGQEIQVTVTVERNASGNFVVTGAPQVTSTSSLNTATAALMAQAAQQLISAINTTQFAPPRPPPAPPVGPTPQAPRTTPLEGQP